MLPQAYRSETLLVFQHRGRFLFADRSENFQFQRFVIIVGSIHDSLYDLVQKFFINFAGSNIQADIFCLS